MADQTLSASALKDVTTDKQNVLGATVQTKDGRSYVYAKAGAVDLVAGAGAKISASTATTGKKTSGAHSAGAKVLKTDIGTVSTPSIYEDAVATITNVQYLVNAVTGSGGVNLDDALVTSPATGTAIVFTLNSYNEMIAQGGAGTTLVTPEVAVPAGSYFWGRKA